MGRKEIRQKQILNIILELGYIPDTCLLAEKCNVSERTIQNDLEAITPSIPETAKQELHQIVMLQLRKRAPEMSDRDLIKLAEFFLIKMTTTKVESKGELKVQVNRDKEFEDLFKTEYKGLFSEEEKPVSEDDIGESVDSSHADAQAG